MLVGQYDNWIPFMVYHICYIFKYFFIFQIFLAKLVGKYRKQGIKITDERVSTYCFPHRYISY